MQEAVFVFHLFFFEVFIHYLRYIKVYLKFKIMKKYNFFSL